MAPVCHAPVFAQWQPGGVPLCEPPCFGNELSLVEDMSGGAIVVWRDTRDYSLTREDIYASRVLNSGLRAPGWPDTGMPVVNEYDSQHPLNAISDGAGGLYAVWIDYRGTANSDVYVQRLLADGSVAPGWIPNGVPACTRSGPQSLPQIALDGAGGVFVVWEDRRMDLGDIYMQHLNGDGSIASGWVLDGLAVSEAPGQQTPLGAIPDGAGGVYMVVWDRSAGSNDTYLQRVGADGSPASGWPARGLPIATTPASEFPVETLIADAVGGVYVAWDIGDPVLIQSTLYALRVLPDGSVAPGWPTGGLVICDAPDTRNIPRGGITEDGTGGFIAAWEDYRGYFSGTASDIYGIRIQSDGTRAPGWAEDGNPLVITPTFDLDARVANDGYGGMYIALEQESTSLIATQHITPDGQVAPGWTLQGVPVHFSPGGSEPRIVAAEPGAAIVAWNQAGVGLRAQKLVPDGPVAAEASLVASEATPERVALTWAFGDEAVPEVTIQRRRDTGPWHVLATRPVDGSHRVTYEDTEVEAGARYAYRLGWLEGGIERFTSEAWVEVPAAFELALHGLHPNPARGVPSVAFTLPNDAPATLELIDVTGRRVARRDLTGPGAGRHVVRLEGGARIAPGVYFVRLTQGGRSLLARGVVVR